MRGLERVLRLFEDDKPGEPSYDPVHVGAACVGTLAAIGALYWLLWTLLVYEGGLFKKLANLAAGARAAGPLNDPYEGWLANVIALALCALVIAALHRLYRDAARR